jgi:uncharacterized protein (DUF1697 family)
MMVTYIALLRGINVGGYKKIAMADLRALMTHMGFESPRSLLQSGNLVFRSKVRSTGKLEQLLEAGTKKKLSFETHFFIRSAQEWQSIIDHNPFPGEADGRPRPSGGHAILRKSPEPGDLKTLQRAISGSEVIHS